MFSKPLAVYLTLMFAGPLVAPLQGGEEIQGFTQSNPQGPVVSGPALPPVLYGSAEPLLPLCDDEFGGASPQAPWSEPSHCSAPTYAGLSFGASSRALFGAQVANGQAARMVLYQYDFLPGNTALAPAGRRKLEKLFPLLVQSPFPLIIEPAGNLPHLDAARRQRVIEHLANLSYLIPDERVIVALPPSRGMSGPEGLGLHVKFMEMMSGGGVSSGVPAVPRP